VSEPLTIVVYGTPAPQGSKRAFYNKAAGRAMAVEQNKVPVDQWRSDVKDAALKAMTERQPFDRSLPLFVRVVFTFKRPDSHYRTGANSHLLRDSSPIRPVKSGGDIDKLQRSTFDALTAAGVWGDDKQICEVSAIKTWAAGNELESLDHPGAHIYVEVYDGPPF
jgi:crossover junction endodeoxyribonuclease RusA